MLHKRNADDKGQLLLNATSKKLVVRNEEQRLVEGIIYEPYQLDTWGTMMLPETVAQMAYDFATKRMTFEVDYEHNEISSGCEVIRHWIAGPNDPDGYREGAWVGITKVHNDEMWDKVKRGEINGYSIHCYAAEVEFDAVINQVRSASGVTEVSSSVAILPNHVHEVSLQFNKEGQVTATRTSEVLGHSHPVYYSTSTENVFDHSHPIIIQGISA